jgi:PleD family two-component response regulator
LNTDLNEAEKIAGELRVVIQKYEFSQSSKVTISLGVSTILNDEDPLCCFNRWDKALYEAKRTAEISTVRVNYMNVLLFNSMNLLHFGVI